MALKKEVKESRSGFQGELVAPTAYWKVDQVIGGKKLVKAIVHVHTEQNGKMIACRDFEFVPSMDGSNFIKQAYEHIKSLDEFANAEDC